MNKIYEDAVDLNVVARLIYKKANATYAYADSDTTVKMDEEMLTNAFKKGALIIDGDNIYKPVALEVSDGVATITYVTADAQTATTAVLATLVSSAFTF